MPQQDSDDILGSWKPKGTATPSRPKSPAAVPPKPTGDILGDWNPGATASSAKPAAAPAAPPPSNVGRGSFLTRPISETIANDSASKRYAGFIDQLLPASIRKEKGGQWVNRFAAELGKAAPEVIDFVQSPLGMGLLAAHMFPATAPFAAIIDLGLGGAGLMEAAPKVAKAYTEGTPESWAEAVKDIVASTGMLKAGGKTLLSGARRMSIEPLSDRKALREEISKIEDVQGKVKALEDAQDPTSKPDPSRKAYGSAFLREPAKIANIRKPRLMQVSADIVSDRSDFVNVRNFDINRMLLDFKKEVPVADREIQKLGYVIQGDATPDEVGLSKAARDWLPRLQDWTAAQDKILREAYGDALPLQESENYLSQVWDFGDRGKPFRQSASRKLMNDPFLKKRTIDSYKTGIEQYGLKPKYNDVADLFKRRADFATNAIANRRMAGWLRDMGAILNQHEFDQIQPVGVAGSGTGKRPGFSDWHLAEDATALYRAAYSDHPEGGGAIMKPVYVHPDFADAVNTIFGKSFNHPAWLAYDTLRALGKKSGLSFSMFHHWALSEQAVAIHATRSNPIKTMSKMFFFNPEFYRGLKSMLWETVGRDGGKPPVMRIKPEVVKDWLGAGLNLKSEDAESHIYQQLSSMEDSNNRFLKGMAKTAKPLARALKGWDTALWDYYHQGMMLDSVETIYADELPRMKNPTPEKVTGLRRNIAEHVNNAFGSISYEKMLISPKGRQALNTILLAPAWTFSNFRVLSSGYENESSFRLADKYVKGAAISWFASVQAMNYALSGHFNKDEQGKPKPRWTWENPGVPAKLGGRYLDGLTENAFNVYAGRNKDGSEKYIVFGKGFREPISWMLAPAETFWGKISMPLRGAMVQATGSTPGSGFKEIDFNAAPGEVAAQRLAAGLESAGVPFIARDPVKKVMHEMFPRSVQAPVTSSQFSVKGIPTGLPTKKGMSFARTEQAYRDAMDSGEFDKAQRILADAAQNHIDPRKIVQTYKQDKRKRDRQERGPLVEYDETGQVVKK